LLTARPLAATDLSPAGATASAAVPDVTVDPARLTGPIADLAAIATTTEAGDDLTGLAADMAPWLADPVVHRQDILDAIDGWIARAMALFTAASFFAVPGSGTGFLYDWKRRQASGPDTGAIDEEVLRFAAELAARVTGLAASVAQRAEAARVQVDAAAGASTPAAAVQALTAAAKTLLGEDFRIVPEFRLDTESATGLAAAWADRADLLGYLTDPEPAGLGIDHPVDDWLYGLARVRPAARSWEQVTMLATAFGTADPQLVPVQLPHRAADRWLGLAHPPDYRFDGERLLYTAHHAVPFDPTAAQCGLLLDEWTEVIPVPDLTTGIAINYDRPSAEPPQAMLLVVSPSQRGSWQWDDVIDAVRETFAEARLRAVEPTRIDETGYASLLPATLSAVTTHAITIMLDLAVNNRDTS
jgi:hypothetical protein